MTTKQGFATYVITEPCVGLKDATCVEVCPVDCIESSPQEPQFYINPELCIACEQCVLVCPVDAISLENEVPEKWSAYIEKNAAFFREATAAVALVSQEEALSLVMGAKQRAQELGLVVSVAVLDKRGDVVAEDFTGAMDADRDGRARDKAYTALTLERATSVVNERMLRNAPESTDRTRIVLETGGLPFGKPYVTGGLGIAGGTPDQDNECGLAAIASWNRWVAKQRGE
jgi:ferredoxin